MAIKWPLTLYYFVLAPKISGTLSVVGSSYIIQDVLRDPQKRKKFSSRIMLGLSVMDVLSSFSAFVLTSWPRPAGSMPWAVGTVETCDASAFFTTIGFFGVPLYNCALVTYYLVQLNYGWPDRKIKAIEKWFHIVPWSVGVLVAIAGVATKSFGPFQSICWVTRGYPEGCYVEGSGVRCIRGTGITASLLFNFAYNLVMLFALFFVSIVMFKIFRAIRTVEKKSAKYSISKFRRTISNTSATNTTNENQRSRFVAMQGLFYSGALILVIVMPLISFITVGIFKKNLPVDHPLFLIMSATTPLHGFLNTLIYLTPLFKRMLNDRREKRDPNRQSLGMMLSKLTRPSTGPTEEQNIERPFSLIIKKSEVEMESQTRSTMQNKIEAARPQVSFNKFTTIDKGTGVNRDPPARSSRESKMEAEGPHISSIKLTTPLIAIDNETDADRDLKTGSPAASRSFEVEQGSEIEAGSPTSSLNKFITPLGADNGTEE